MSKIRDSAGVAGGVAVTASGCLLQCMILALMVSIGAAILRFLGVL